MSYDRLLLALVVAGLTAAGTNASNSGELTGQNEWKASSNPAVQAQTK